MTAYVISVWIHVVAAATWVGSMIFFAAVVVPVLRREDVRDRAPGLMRMLGARFRVLGWVALGVLIVTGISNLLLRGIGWSSLRDRTFWATSFGRALGAKLVCVGLVLVATAAHDVLFGKRAIQALEQDPAGGRAVRSRRLASWLGRAVLVLSLAILLFATALVRGFL